MLFLIKEKTEILNKENCLLQDEEFKAIDLSEAIFEDAEIKNCRFERVYLEFANFLNANCSGGLFKDSHFEKACLEQMQGAFLIFESDVFINTNLKYINFNYSTFKSVIFEESDMYKSFSDKVRFDTVFFNNCELKHTIFSGCQMLDVDFSGTDLTNAMIAGGTEFNNVSFKNANLTGVRFKQCTLSKVDFSGANLENIEWNEGTNGWDTHWLNVTGLDTAINVPDKLKKQLGI
jgi:uncharacterized protein YjbI with pentapeptide repeats